MIVQTAPAGQPHFIIANYDHAQMAGVFARAFGNEVFAPLDPRELIEYVVFNHEAGWAEVDKEPQRDPRTGLVYHLADSPQEMLIRKSRIAPSFNERHHPLCGLLSSMHVWGLYHNRYGLSDKVSIEIVNPEDRPAVDAMLQDERDRQARLKAQLAADPATAPWVEETRLFHNYKLLEFLDTIALYFNLVHESQWTEVVYPNVPRAIGDDVSVIVKPIGPATVSVAPWPFNTERLDVACAGRYLSPQPEGVDIGAVLRDQPVEYQRFVVVAG
jgi:hypothetical protein